MRTLEVIRKMDGFEKRLANLIKEFDSFKEEVNDVKKSSKKVDKSNIKKNKE